VPQSIAKRCATAGLLTATVVGAALLSAMVLPALLVSSAAEARNIERRGHIRGDRPTLPCTIQVDFRAAGNGPDMAAFVAVRQFILESPDIDHAEAWGWGDNGAFSFCLIVYAIEPAQRVHAALTDMIAAENRSTVDVTKGPRWPT
jgi:hypothetical protein